MCRQEFSIITLIVLIVSVSAKLWFLIKLYNNFTNSRENLQVLHVHQLKFDYYLKDFNKSYTGEEYRRRFENFKKSLKDIAVLNVLEKNATFGLTKFSDMSKEEFASSMLWYPSDIPPCETRTKNCENKTSSLSSMINRRYGDEIPSSFDWRNKGVVKPVLDQKLCFGCWAFSIIGVMESMSAIRNISFESLSIQELLDCSEFNNGCRGGHVSLAMDYLCDSRLPVDTEQHYPLTLADDRNCRVPANGRKIKEFLYQCNLNEDTLVYQVATHGPLIAAVDARNWINYIDGIIQRACSRGHLNHVVQIVGYDGYGDDSETSIPYYIVRNSFGEDFGDQGYVKIAMNNDVCGIAEQVTAIDVY